MAVRKKVLSVCFCVICLGANSQTKIYFPSSYYMDSVSLEKNISILVEKVTPLVDTGKPWIYYPFQIANGFIEGDHQTTIKALEAYRKAAPPYYEVFLKAYGIQSEAYARAKLFNTAGEAFAGSYTKVLRTLYEALPEEAQMAVRPINEIIAPKLPKGNSDSLTTYEAVMLLLYYSHTKIGAATDMLTAPVMAEYENKHHVLPGLTSGGKLNPFQAKMDIRHYTLSLDVDIPGKQIAGDAVVKMNLLANTDTVILDLVRVMKVSRVILDNKPVPFQHKEDKIFIAGKFKKGMHDVKVEYKGHPPVAAFPPWIGGFSWYKGGKWDNWVVINCQEEGGKIYFPCKDHPGDEPDEGVDMFITIPDTLSVAGPGLLQSVKKQHGKATWHWKTSYTISNYCIVFNIGKYTVVKDEYTTVNGNKVPIEFYVSTRDSMYADRVIKTRKFQTPILEKYFGEYPWVREKIGIAQTPATGMEHQTMITHGEPLEDMTELHGAYHAPVFLHEYIHEWWANKITNKDWAHVWIQEGIATYGEALFFREAEGEQGYDSVMEYIRGSITDKAPVVQGEGLTMRQAFNNMDNNVYFKGAFFMHTLRYVLGDTVFFPALKKFISDVKHPYTRFFTTEDVERFFSKESGKDLKPLFHFYLYTTNKLDFNINKISEDNYAVYLCNNPFGLPVDIQTDTGITRVLTTDVEKPFKITSKTMPVIDPGNNLYKTVSFKEQ
ncbi:MAG: M1 family metallopeptidase [Agriterribacter sp.]